ncbi:MAG: dehydrogenase [Verrucomicrobiales bacterium]|nr:dehydrogenase [Verrucomicrobiales bacterium]|tara:strand:+ start:8608 stop:9876 length:1269 start_codon:yes stop_codon:yes gene_type:complete
MKSRRSFLKSVTAAGVCAPAIISANPNSKISVACIGPRRRGNSVMRSFAAQRDCAITHLCDVRDEVLEVRGREMKEVTGLDPKRVKDYRELLDDPSIDAFIVATPDHWHAMLTIEGCRAGKDVYVEKPASHNILEGKVAVEMAHKHDRMVQMGTQVRSAPFLKEAREYVKSGAMGRVISGKSWETATTRSVHLKPDAKAPAGIDYDLWLGPAPHRKYNPSIVDLQWRWMFDYGTGDLGNDGVHRVDYCRYLMGLEDFPQAINASGGKLYHDDDQEWPDTLFVNYEYPKAIVQYEMRLWSRPQLFGTETGAAIYGENGWMLVTNRSWTAYDSKGKVVRNGQSSVGQTEHVRNFLDAVINRKRDSLNQEILSGHISSAMCHMGNIAWRTGKRLKFDAKTQTFDDAEANKLVGREHRKGFELPNI